MSEHGRCCDAFAARVLDQFEQQRDGTWNITGCCGGQCYVTEGMRFCPFCGSVVATLPKTEGSAP